MKRTSNLQQDNYLVLTALMETLKNKEECLEREYIKENGITNEDGGIPERIYCIDNEETFDKANKGFSETPKMKTLWAEILKCRDAIKMAEDELIEFALSIAPSAIRNTIEPVAKTDYTTRKKLIELILKLNVSTVNKGRINQ